MAQSDLFVVFGGVLTRLDGVTFEDPSKIHLVGIFASYDEAYKAWSGAARATIDDAHMRYFLLPLDFSQVNQLAVRTAA